jgi:2-methylcitrate dehydratase PrpD
MERATQVMAAFVAEGAVPDAALERAAAAVSDTVGVTLAGAREPAARQVRAMAVREGRGDACIMGAAETTSATAAAFANGVAAHALDFDDMCFVSMAHPSCALLPAALAASELARASGKTLLDGYVAGFEIECRLGEVMNPRHYHGRGWHCTSTIGTVGAAAAAARILGLSTEATQHALGIAASAACGLKENMGSMVKPLHAGMAARNGVMAALLAQDGYTASDRAIEGPQGFLAVMDAERPTLDSVGNLGSHWEILTTGITVKLYPSCAATHPTLDVVLDLARTHRLHPDDIASIDVDVDSMTPRLLMYDRPHTGLEGKFSMPFCVATALVHGAPSIETFDPAIIEQPTIQALLPNIRMRVNTGFDASVPLSRTTVTMRLHDGRVIAESRQGARGGTAQPATNDDLAAKFAACARRALSPDASTRAWATLQRLRHVASIAELTRVLTTDD